MTLVNSSEKLVAIVTWDRTQKTLWHSNLHSITWHFKDDDFSVLNIFFAFNICVPSGRILSPESIEMFMVNLCCQMMAKKMKLKVYEWGDVEPSLLCCTVLIVFCYLRYALRWNFFCLFHCQVDGGNINKSRIKYYPGSLLLFFCRQCFVVIFFSFFS